MENNLLVFVQNAHAYVTAAFKVQVSKDGKTLSGKPKLVFGGVSSYFVHATNTENFLVGREINHNSTLAGWCCKNSY